MGSGLLRSAAWTPTASREPPPRWWTIKPTHPAQNCWTSVIESAGPSVILTIIARGGRRGRLQTRGPTHGLVWAPTRHATSRAGDPEPHDHVLIANLCHMADGKGGWKALDT